MASENNQSQPETTQPQAGAESPAATSAPEKSDFSKAFAEFSKDETALPSQPSDGTGSTGAVEQPKAPAETPNESAAPSVEAKTPATPEATPTTSPPPDKGSPLDWSKVPEEFRRTFEAEAAQRKTLDDQYRRLQAQRSAEGRQRAQARSQPATDEAPKAEKPNGTALLDKKAADELKADFPQLAPFIDNALETRAELQSVKQHIASQSLDSAEQILDVNERELARRHSDWFDLSNGKAGEAMGLWLLKQPQWLQDIARRNETGIHDIDAADEVLTRYKSDIARPSTTPAPSSSTQQGANRRSRQLDGSATVHNKSPSVTHGVPNDFSSAFKHFSENPEARP